MWWQLATILNIFQPFFLILKRTAMQKCVLDLTNVCDNCHQMTIVLCDDVGSQSSKRCCVNLSLCYYY